MIESYDIVILAGQSNASGRGKGNTDFPYVADDKIEMIYDPQPCPFKKDKNGNDYLEVIKPYKFIHEIAGELKEDGKSLGNFALTFASEYLKNGLLDDKRKLLIVNTAVGGTGFTKHHWGKGEILSERMFEMVDYALSTGRDNKIVALLWHQGEHDAFEGAEINKSPEEICDFYKGKLSGFIDDVKKTYGYIPIIAGELCHDWWNKNKAQCDAVMTATKEIICKYGKGGVVSSESLLSNDQKISDGDEIHFCRQSLVELGKRYFEKYLSITKINSK